MLSNYPPEYRLFYFTCGKSFYTVLLRIFRINDPYRLIGILVILILVSLPLFIDPVNMMLDELKLFVLGESLNHGNHLYAEVSTATPPLLAWISGWLEMSFGRGLTALRLISLVFIFFQLSFFTILLINSRAFNENTYLPGLLFGILALFSFDMLTFSGELVASTVLLLALNNLLKEIEFRIQRDETIFNLGFYIGLASLLVFSYAVYLPGALIILAIFTRLTIRKSLLVTFGFIIPHSLVMLLFFMKGEYASLVEDYYLANFLGKNDTGMGITSVWVLCATPVLFLILSLFTLNRAARLTKYQSQISQIMLLWILLAATEIVISGNIKPHQLITFFPPFTYFISHYILLIRRKTLAELAIWGYVVIIISIMYLTRYDRLKRVNYTALYPAKTGYSQIINKRVLILGTDWGLLKNNKLAGGFYDWSLSKNTFTELDYFGNVVLIDRAFNEDRPEVIIDEENKMKDVFKRIPTLQFYYTRKGNIYYRSH